MGDSSSIYRMEMSFMGAEPAGEATLMMASTDRGSSVSHSVYGTVIRWTLLVGVFLMPIFFLPWTTSVLELNKQILVMAMAGVGLIAWLLSVVSTGKLSWHSTPFDKAVLSVLGVSVVATVFSMARWNSLFGLPNDLSSALATVLSLAIIYFLVVDTVDDGGAELAKALGLSLVLALIYGLLQIIGLYVIRLPFSLSHAFNSVGSIDGLGVAAAISLPLLSRRVEGWTRYAYKIGLAVALAILIILNWWVLWAVAITGMVGVIAFGSLNHEKFSIGRFVFPMTVIVIAVFLLVVNFNLAAIKNNLPIEVGPSFTLSGHVAKAVLKESFVTGYGPTAFSMAFDRYGAAQLTNSTLSSAKFFDATSQVFNAVVEGGLLEILALLVLIWSVIQGIRFYVRAGAGISADAQTAWAMLAAVGTAYAFYPFNLTLTFLAYMSLALAALSLWGGHRRTFDIEDNAALSLTSSLGFIGGLILVLVGVYFGLSNYVGDTIYAKAVAETDVTKAANDLVTAVNWNGHSDAYYRAASQAALGLLSQELNKKADPTDTQRSARVQNYMSSTINLAKTATDLNPRESLNWENLGNVYQNLLGLVNGVDTLSEASYKKAAELRPGDATFANEIGSMYLAEYKILQQIASGSANAGQLRQQATTALTNAETNFSQAVSMSSNYGLAIYNLGLVYDQESKLSDAIKQLEKIAPANNDQPDLLFELGLLYYRNNQMDQALNTLQQVLVLQPNYANAHWYLSLIYEQRKDIPNAIAEVQKILSVDANKGNQTVLTRLQQLQSGKPTGQGVNQKPL